VYLGWELSFLGEPLRNWRLASPRRPTTVSSEQRAANGEERERERGPPLRPWSYIISNARSAWNKLNKDFKDQKLGSSS
jgi:hypothetical protein